MARILCLGDLHIMDKPPAGATDEYLEDLFACLEYTTEIARDNDFDAVVWAGDVFHHKNPARTSHATVLRVINIIKKYGDIPLYIVTGNHDISNDRLESVHEKQPLGVLFEAGARELVGWGDSLPIYGVPWQMEWSEENIARALDSLDDAVNSGGEKRSKTLVVTHCSIFPPEQVENVPYEHVPAETWADALGHAGSLYYGHIHEFHGIYKVGGVTFANGGALSRGSLHEYNLHRGIFATIWEDGEFSLLDIPHKPATDILRVADHEDEREEKMDLDEFVKSVGESSISITSTSDIIKHINSLDVEKPVKTRAIELVESVS